MSAQPVIPDATPNDPPDWTTIAADVACPLCDYNLRGLAEPRCPECGYAFAWPELLDPDRRDHPYLFEHHARHNVWSFLRTLIGGLRPRRFWGRLRPGMRASPWRLAAYAVLVTALLVAAPFGSFARQYAERAGRAVQGRQQYRAFIVSALNDPVTRAAVQRDIARHGSAEAMLDRAYPSPFTRAFLAKTYAKFRYTHGEVATLFVMTAWPWVTLASLMIFRWSMRRARVKTGHVVRCVVYGFDWGFWLIPILFFAITSDLAVRAVGLRPEKSLPMLACAPIAAYGTYRLGAAYARYLRFDHPYATALASQVMVGTAMAGVVLFLA